MADKAIVLHTFGFVAVIKAVRVQNQVKETATTAQMGKFDEAKV